MSTILDAYTKELLAWVLTDSLDIDFVLETVQSALLRITRSSLNRNAHS